MSKTGTSAIEALNQLKLEPQMVGSCHDVHGANLICEVMGSKGAEAIETFMEMCGDRVHLYPGAIKIGEMQLKLIHHTKLFLAHLDLSKDQIEDEMNFLTEFLLQGQRVAMPAQNLVGSLQKEDVR